MFQEVKKKSKEEKEKKKISLSMNHLWKQSLDQKQLVRLWPCQAGTITPQPSKTIDLWSEAGDEQWGLSVWPICFLVEACRRACEHTQLPQG